MDESACLVRSFSNPVDVSREVREGDPVHGPIHALTESISFGRFMSESLEWEKWSTFSHNRYLEEVEKFSKPGSVAQKKAFFEDHYKKRAAMRAATLLEQANIVTNDASQMGTINKAAVEPSLNVDLANSNMSSAANQHKKDVSDAEIANTAYVDAGNLNVVRESDVTDMEQGPTMMEEDVYMEECQQVENSNAFENGDIHDKIMATPPVPPKKLDDPKNSTSSSKKRRTNSSSKSSLPDRASKSPLYPSKRLAPGQARNDADVAKSTGNSNDKKKTMPNLLHMSIDLASSAGKTNKTSLRMSKDSAIHPQTPTKVLKKAADQETLAPSSEKRQSNSTSKLSNHGGVSKQVTSRIGNKSNNHAFINKKSALDSIEQKRITQKSLHMSLNFSPRAGEATKTSPKTSRESSTPLQTLSRPSVNGGSKHASQAPQSRDKRTIPVNKSVSAAGDKRWPPIFNGLKSLNASGTGTRSLNASGISTRSLNASGTGTRSLNASGISTRSLNASGIHTRSLNASGTSTRSITSRPFIFRSEERAEKRKEFFKKLEDKMNSKEAEKPHSQIKSKEKVKNDLNKSRQSTDVKARSNEDPCHGSQIPHNDVKKITSTGPQAPKQGSKPSHSTMQNANSRPPRMPSINTESTKNGLMKNNRISGTSLPKKRHENASPNIQVSVGKVGIPYKHENGGSVAGGCRR
ncbi:hypothetical protein HRI_001177600 [Hibiscus trionum]|uniref:TPX2 C-terminal domain-containing protein n=1 Tax=Hibiscus trionum TaxID=183268 RepID=A0A9W7HDV3_HIBTR|nr:hypothetical protein HRI_001177600 [Hibiscus trionum]